MRTLVVSIDPFLSSDRGVGEQHFQHHVLALAGTGTVGLHHHAGLRGAAATRGQGAFALDLHYAGAAIAIRAVARLVAEVGNLDAQTMRRFPQGFAGMGVHGLAVELDGDLAHDPIPGVAG